MAKDPSPLLGYNNNIRHKNRVFHIQTEDSGVRHPHVITHLFMDGGRILKSVKTSYAEHLGAEKMADMVRKMMKDQHKGMLIALRDGRFDVAIEGGDVPKPAASSPDAVGKAAASAPAIQPVIPPAIPSAPSSAPELPLARPQMRSNPVLPVTMDKVPQVDISDADQTNAPLVKSGEGMPLDLTPPPANMFRPRGTGSYSELGDPSGGEETKPTPAPTGRNPSRPPSKGSSSIPPGAVGSKSTGLRSPPIRRGSTPPPARTDSEPRARRTGSSPVIVERPAESRYASARPAAIFGQSKPRGGSSIFGEDIISDKSLDEVIMSYLADDLAPGGAGEGGKSPSGARPIPPKPRK